MMTTYDFVSKTFGHATMRVGGWEWIISGRRFSVSPEGDALITELADAKERLKVEEAKEAAGEPFDAQFVYGVDPTDWILSGETLVKVGPRQWKRGRR